MDLARRPLSFSHVQSSDAKLCAHSQSIQKQSTMDNLTSLDLLKLSNLGGRSFRIQKSMLQILDLETRLYLKKIATLLSENEGRRGSKAVWNFSENSPVLVASPVPNPYDMPHEGDYKGGLK